jgi:hypothetical protein
VVLIAGKSVNDAEQYCESLVPDSVTELRLLHIWWFNQLLLHLLTVRTQRTQNAKEHPAEPKQTPAAKYSHAATMRIWQLHHIEEWLAVTIQNIGGCYRVHGLA